MKPKIVALVILSALFLINPISQHQANLFANPKDGIEEFTQEGVASWYGPGFQGRKTANGERFNTNDMTAAHKTLPFNTMVRVINLSNDMTTIVRINDRGPYAHGRIIDLSKAAKNDIGMGGLAEVRIEVITEEQLEREQREAELALIPVNLFEVTFPLESKVFMEYSRDESEGEFGPEITEEEFNTVFNTFKRVKIKVLTPNTDDANSTIYQALDELPNTNYYDVTNRVKFVKGYTFEIAEFDDKLLAYELVGKLESSNFGTIFIEELISEDSTKYKIFVGNYKIKRESRNDKKLLKRMDYVPRLVKIGS